MRAIRGESSESQISGRRIRHSAERRPDAFAHCSGSASCRMVSAAIRSFRFGVRACSEDGSAGNYTAANLVINNIKKRADFID